MSSGDNWFSRRPLSLERVEPSNALDGPQWDARSLAPPSSLVPAPTWEPQPAVPSQAVRPTTEPGRPSHPAEPSTSEQERPTRQAQPSTSAEPPNENMDYFGEYLKFIGAKVIPLEASSLEELLEKLDSVLESSYEDEERDKFDALHQSLVRADITPAVEESPEPTTQDTMETQETETASTPTGAHYCPQQVVASPQNMAGDSSNMFKLNGNSVNPRPSHGQMTVTSATELCNGTSRKRPREDTEKEPNVKKPRSAFTIYCADQRHKVMRQLRVTDLDTVNFVLSKRWQLMSFKERALYKDKAEKESKYLQPKFPQRTTAENFATKSKKKAIEKPVAPTPSYSTSEVYCQPPPTNYPTNTAQYQPEAGPSIQGDYYQAFVTYYEPVPTYYESVPTYCPPVPTYYESVPTYCPPVPTYYESVPTYCPPVPTYYQQAPSTQGPYFLPGVGLQYQPGPAFFY